MAGLFALNMPTTNNVTGREVILADTGLAGGAAPQSVGLGINQIAPLCAPRNIIDGGDFTINPFQRGTAFTGITNTPTYTADRFFAVGGAASSISVSYAALAAGALAGFGGALQFGRAAANTDVSPIKLGQVIETGDSIRLQGQPLVLSFYAVAGANLSAAGSNITVSVFSGSGTNQSAAAMIAGTWTGQATVTAQVIAVVPTAWGLRYTVIIPPIATNVTQLGVVFQYTPFGTAGASDYFQITGIQMEPGMAPSQFERLDIQVALEIAQRYCWVLSEPAAAVVTGAGMNTTAAIQVFYIALPVQMVKAPTVTVVAAGTFKTNQAGTQTATTVTPGTTHTVNAISINGNSAGVAGQATLLTGGGGAGQIVVSADF